MLLWEYDRCFGGILYCNCFCLVQKSKYGLVSSYNERLSRDDHWGVNSGAVRISYLIDAGVYKPLNKENKVQNTSLPYLG